MAGLKEFTIEKNEYLDSEVRGFYRCDYIKFKEPENPDYLVVLKNTGRKQSHQELQSAIYELADNLNEEIRYLIEKFDSKDDILICVVPRSKSYDFYKQDELLFSYTIDRKVNQLIEKNVGIENGVDYIVRHTNTKTTHLSKSKYGGGDGEMPYPGITNDTCNISDKVIGKKILLIDDIYTKTINVDEDVIQALLDKGASEIIFFAIAKTKSKFEQDDFDGITPFDFDFSL